MLSIWREEKFARVQLTIGFLRIRLAIRNHFLHSLDEESWWILETNTLLRNKGIRTRKVMKDAHSTLTGAVSCILVHLYVICAREKNTTERTVITITFDVLWVNNHFWDNCLFMTTSGITVLVTESVWPWEVPRGTERWIMQCSNRLMISFNI